MIKKSKNVKHIWERKSFSFQEAQKFDRSFWQRAGVTARFAAAWSLVLDYYKIKGQHGDKPRLRRTVQNIEYLKKAKSTAGRPEDKLDLRNLRKKSM